MKKTLLSLFAAFAMAATASAQVTYTATAGGNKWNEDEGPAKIFDGNTETKWCANPGDNAYVIFNTSAPVYVWGYEFTTANDNEQYGRNPTKWTLCASNEESAATDKDDASWTQISQWENNCIQRKNYTSYRFFCSPAQTQAYKYYKLIIDKSSDGLFQISEFKLCCDTEPLVTYKWDSDNADGKSQKACDLLLGQKWEDNNLAGKWIIMETSDGQPHTLKGYSFTTNDDGSWNNRAPKRWTIEGSNDKNTWNSIEAVTNDPIKNENYQTFDFTPVRTDIAYRYIRLNLVEMKSTGWTQIGEFHPIGGNVASWQQGYNYVEGDNENLAKVFDKNSHTKAEGGQMPDGVKFIVETADQQPHTVAKYYLSTHDDGSWKDRAPKSWLLEGSNDKNEWVTLHDVADGEIENIDYGVKGFVPTNIDASVRYLRMTVRSFKGGYHQLAEFDAVGACTTHDWVLTSGKEATCTENGGAVYTCSGCGNVKVLANIEKLGHDYADGICTRCHDVDASYMTAVDGFYQPTTAAQFTWLAAMIQAGNEVNIKLTQDVDLSGFSGFGNGTDVVPFKGEFDGQGHWLKNLRIDVAKKNTGLFGMIEGANIHDLGLDNAYVKTSWGNANAGGIAGNAKNATINRVAVVKDSYVEGYDHVGAIVGNTEGNTVISNCLADITVLSGAYQAGGLVGTSNGLTLENSLFTGEVRNNNYNASGLVALIDGTGAPTTLRNNISAASKVWVGQGNGLYSLINTGGRSATYENNHVATEVVYCKGNSEETESKTLTNPNDENGVQTPTHDMQCKSFIAETMGWDMTNNWKMVAAGQWPVLAWMDAETAQAVTIGAAGYATLVATAELNFEGLSVVANAAQVNKNEDGYVHLEPVQAVPAGNAVVLTAEPGQYQIPYAVEYAAAITENNLVAATADVEADGSQYVLAKPAGEEVGFYQVNEGTTIAAGKGYLVMAAGVKAYLFESETATGISNANANDNKEIYNLAGQKMTKMQKGINIVDGKKILK